MINPWKMIISISDQIIQLSNTLSHVIMAINVKIFGPYVHFSLPLSKKKKKKNDSNRDDSKNCIIPESEIIY